MDIYWHNCIVWRWTPISSSRVWQVTRVSVPMEFHVLSVSLIPWYHFNLFIHCSDCDWWMAELCVNTQSLWHLTSRLKKNLNGIDFKSEGRLTRINKNYYVVKNAGFTCSRNTFKFTPFFKINEWIMSVSRTTHPLL